MVAYNNSKPFVSKETQSLLRSIGKIKNIPESTYLFYDNMPAHHIYLVESGLIKIWKTSEDGKELTLRLCQHNAIIGELALFNANAVYLLNAKTLKESNVYVVNIHEFEEALMNTNDLAIEFIRWSTEHMRVFQYKIRDLTMYGKTGALYSTLIRLANSYGIMQKEGIKINLPITDTELATFAAATRESANRMLVDLRERDIVSRLDSGEIIIKDLEYLRKEIGCDECPLGICHIN